MSEGSKSGLWIVDRTPTRYSHHVTRHRARCEKQKHFSTDIMTERTAAIVVPRRTRPVRTDEDEAWQRARSQRNQRRYRSRKKIALEALEGHVHALRRDVCTLTAQVQSHQAAVARPPISTTVATNIAVEYFRVFEHGLRSAWHPLYEAQAGFLRSVMAPDLQFMETSDGVVHKLFEQLDLYSTLFDSLHMQCDRLDVLVDADDEVIVRALAVLDLRLSRASIEAIYPNLVASNEPFVQSLVGRLLHVPILTHFYVNMETHMVHTLSTTADIASASSNLVGSVQESLVALEKTRLHANAEISLPARPPYNAVLR
ncbi:hypothetical protein SPRG_03884 [Saprolegnia parasitica CBS 223.65]|uniref:BZIP domain-containing protein n=1 Tax=Saprolegnia parasitica (strain CBS 223.65) TaxID=695850 RepID=A0A067CKN3_SAPPC|nr:hypothetical protein SPRG_03884 [Saprolegnia parasitica CBS 223.65]KDO31269.1 hypothetical protein SPRG_03884 [Saprolegnia parasitica CBS 223.65]|eukprot:XP_012197868.1 hypothetical protein SPRG_03884 [Saprolegnia parasitica CBS 223.65]